MTEAVISLGSNFFADENLNRTKMLLKEHFSILAESSILFTQPHGKQYKNTFSNQAVKIQSSHTKIDTISIFKHIEKQLGRTPQSKSEGVIPIDIDLIIWNNEITHPDYFRFNFVKQTVDEIK